MYQSCLVYKFTCPGDLNNQYIGDTERQLFVRVKEHVTPTNSAVFKHDENCGYWTIQKIIYNCFEMIETCSSHDDLLSTEAWLNKKLQLNLHNQLGLDKGSRVTINIFK